MTQRQGLDTSFSAHFPPSRISHAAPIHKKLGLESGTQLRKTNTQSAASTPPESAPAQLMSAPSGGERRMNRLSSAAVGGDCCRRLFLKSNLVLLK